MPSKWEISGIDWDNITKHRTSHVLYELAQATAETYQQAYNSTVIANQSLLSFSLPPSYSQIDFNKRQEEVLFYIIDKLKRMFAIDESYFGDGAFPNGTKCFVSNTEQPNIISNVVNTLGNGAVLYEDYLMGVKTLDYSEGGELEQNCGDLTFLRDDFYFGRITPDILYSIYKILTYPMKCILTPWTKYTTGIHQGLYVGNNFSRYSRYISGNFSAITKDSARGRDSDVNTAVQRMYNKLDSADGSDDIFAINNKFLVYDSSGITIATAQNNSLLANMTPSTKSGIQNGQILTSDLKLDIIQWGFVRTSQIQSYGIFPDNSPFTAVTQRRNDIQSEFQQPFNDDFYDPSFYWNVYEPLITSGLPTLTTNEDRREGIHQTYLGLGKINAKGLMDYYTEDD